MVRDRQFYRDFFAMWIVLVLQNVITLSVNLADNMMLGGYSETALAETENIPRILSTRVSHAYIWIALSVIAHKDSDICKDFLDKRHKICYHIIGKIVGNDLSRF